MSAEIRSDTSDKSETLTYASIYVKDMIRLVGVVLDANSQQTNPVKRARCSPREDYITMRSTESTAHLDRIVAEC